MKVVAKKIAYGGWENCVVLKNNTVDLIIITDVGPRIIRYGFIGEQNEFKEYPKTKGKTGGNQWRIYGGHRLWFAPESRPQTYFPDNHPVQWSFTKGTLHLIQPIEKTTGIQKEMDITLAKKGSHVKIVHRLRNTNLFAVELAPWALSVMAPGGKAIVPLPPRNSHKNCLLPSGPVVLWAYTNLMDLRWCLGKKYITLIQDPKMESPQKLGVWVPEGWAVYIRNNHMFIKKFSCTHLISSYPDHGCNFEMFTDMDMLEVETLGPLTHLEPGATIDHVEQWFLLSGIPNVVSDEDIDTFILPKISSL